MLFKVLQSPEYMGSNKSSTGTKVKGGTGLALCPTYCSSTTERRHFPGGGDSREIRNTATLTPPRVMLWEGSVVLGDSCQRCSLWICSWRNPRQMPTEGHSTTGMHPSSQGHRGQRNCSSSQGQQTGQQCQVAWWAPGSPQHVTFLHTGIRWRPACAHTRKSCG